MSRILSLQTDGPFPDYDALRCAAYRFAKESGETGVSLVLVSAGEAPPVSVVANAPAGEASVVLPLPEWERDYPWGTAYAFPGGVYAVGARFSELPEPAEAFPEADRVYLMEFEREHARLSAVCYDPKTGERFPVPRTAEGAAAAAMLLHRGLQNGTMETTIGQPGGILEIGMRKEAGRVTGLSAGGAVEVTK